MQNERSRTLILEAQNLHTAGRPVDYAAMKDRVPDFGDKDWAELQSLVAIWIKTAPPTPAVESKKPLNADAAMMAKVVAESRAAVTAQHNAVEAENASVAAPEFDPVTVAEQAARVAANAHAEAKQAARGASAAIGPARDRLAKALQRYVSQTVDPESNAREFIAQQQANRRAVADGTASPRSAPRPGPSHYDRLRASMKGGDIDRGFKLPRYAPDGHGGLAPIGERGGSVARKLPSER